MIEDWYKKTIENADILPPDSAWENIQDSLDINLVWDRIDSQLSTPAPSLSFNRRWYYAAALALLLTLSMTYLNRRTQKNNEIVLPQDSQRIAISNLDHKTIASTNSTHTEPKTTKTTLKSQKHTSQADVSNLVDKNRNIKTNHEAQVNIGNLSSNQKDIKKLTKTVIKNKNISNSNETNSSVNGKVDLINKDVVSLTNDQSTSSVAIGGNYSVGISDLETKEASSFITESEISSRAGERLAQLNRRDLGFELNGLQLRYNTQGISRGLETNQLPHGFFIGANVSFTNVWMINNETISGLDKSTMHTTLPSFRYNAGVLIGYTISDYIGMQAECDFLSSYGQSYKEYYHGKYVTKSIDLDYITYKLLLKNKHPFLFKGVWMSSNLIFGASYGRLLKAQENISGENSGVSQLYSNDNFSGIFGYELELVHSQHLMSTLGFRLNAGLNDVSATNQNGNESKTRNFSFEINYALKFYLHK